MYITSPTFNQAPTKFRGWNALRMIVRQVAQPDSHARDALVDTSAKDLATGMDIQHGIPYIRSSFCTLSALGCERHVKQPLKRIQQMDITIRSTESGRIPLRRGREADHTEHLCWIPGFSMHQKDGREQVQRCSSPFKGPLNCRRPHMAAARNELLRFAADRPESSGPSLGRSHAMHQSY